MGPARSLRLSQSATTRRAITLDAGALIAVEQRDRRVWATLQLARRDGWDILVPSGALAQVWRHPSRQASLAAFLKWRFVRGEPLTDGVARRVGILCGRRATSDIVDASVAVCAHDNGGRVLTSDPDDLLALIPTLDAIAVT